MTCPYSCRAAKSTKGCSLLTTSGGADRFQPCAGGLSGRTPDGTFTITNKPVIDFTVEKKWNGAPAAADDWTVTVQLYRSVNGGAGEAVGSEVALSKSTSWKHTFPDLDKYDEYGNQYTYYAREVSVTVDGTTVAVENDAFQVTVSGEELDFAVDYDDTTYKDHHHQPHQGPADRDQVLVG